MRPSRGRRCVRRHEGMIKQLPTPLSVHVIGWCGGRCPGPPQHHHLCDHRDHLPQTVVVGRPRGDPGAGPDRAEPAYGCHCASAYCPPLPRHQSTAVRPRQLLSLMTSIISNEAHPAAARRGVVRQDRRTKAAAALPRHRAGPGARRPSRTTALDRRAGADRDGWILAASAMRQYRARVPYPGLEPRW